MLDSASRIVCGVEGCAPRIVRSAWFCMRSRSRRRCVEPPPQIWQPKSRRGRINPLYMRVRVIRFAPQYWPVILRKRLRRCVARDVMSAIWCVQLSSGSKVIPRKRGFKSMSSLCV